MQAITVKFMNFRERFITQNFSYAYMQSFAKIKPSQNGEITLKLTYIGKSCTSHKYLTWQMCI